MEMSPEPFFGMPNPVLIGHQNGHISIYGKEIIYRDNQVIHDLKVIGKNKVLFSTSEGWMKIIEFKDEVFKDPAVYDRQQYNTQHKIKGFKILDESLQNIMVHDI